MACLGAVIVRDSADTEGRATTGDRMTPPDESLDCRCRSVWGRLRRAYGGGTLNGSCMVNANEVRLTPSIGHYCLVTGGSAAECIYVDITSCDKEARRQQGACIIAPARPESPTPDPFALTRPSNAGAFGTGSNGLSP
jgi:hypothetical protein